MCQIILHFFRHILQFLLIPLRVTVNARKRADIAPLLEVGDMIKMGNHPDWKCVFTYVQSFYRRFGRQTQAADASKRHTLAVVQNEEEEEEQADAKKADAGDK